MRDRRFTAYLHFRQVICLYSDFMGMDKCKAPQLAVPAEFPLFESRATPECIYALNDVCGCGRVRRSVILRSCHYISCARIQDAHLAVFVALCPQVKAESLVWRVDHV